MAWKGVHISRPAQLACRNGQLTITQEGQGAVVALEDVAWIILDSAQVSLTAALVSACMENGICIIFPDDRHMPSGVALPFHRHHRQSAVAALQLAATLPLRKRLWQRIVATKIENQAACLQTCRGEAGGVLAMARLVASGDPGNIEAQAAREYWKRLFDGFTRSDETDLRNKMLNYGYAVLRAAIARALVASGLLPCIGLFHDSATNAFNLADDLIEPFRPLVDLAAFRLSDAGQNSSGTLTLDHRRHLAAILGQDVSMTGETISLLTATERAGESLVRALETSSPAMLCLPGV